ncbi:MAG TPA: DNA adenine methylase [Iamia sp.]|nr:DNA adenine methylase [Iamia sp.]
MTDFGQQRRFPSPLRYPGGKGKVANFIKVLLLENNLVGRDYVEPYAGGAAVALSLLYEDFADHVYINDVDPSVHAFWSAALLNTEQLCRRINDTDVTMEEWHRQRSVQAADDPDLLDLAFSTFFMNRTNRSGIITGGVIGGRDQTGKWKLDARYNKADLIRRILKVGRYRSRIHVSGEDALTFLEPWRTPSSEAFVYLDPPYYVKGGDLYRNSYGPDDHAKVALTVAALGVPWIVSYDAAPPILNLYQEGVRIRYSLAYSAATRGRGSEVMFFSEDLTVPDVASPAGVSFATVDSRVSEAG